VLPVRAEMKPEFRLVAAMAKAEALQRLEAHLEKHGFDDIEVTISDSYAPNGPEEDSVLILVLKRLLGGTDRG